MISKTEKEKIEEATMDIQRKLLLEEETEGIPLFVAAYYLIKLKKEIISRLEELDKDGGSKQ